MEKHSEKLAIKKQKSMVIFEVPGEIKKKSGQLDVSASMEEDHSDKYYSDQFRDFLSTLGFDVESDTLGLFSSKDHVLINMESFVINLEKTSLLAKNAYIRKDTERKDRCIEIHTTSYCDSLVAKVKFNIEIDKQALISKIEKAITLKQENRKAIQNRVDHQKAMLDQMRLHYYRKDCIGLFVERIYLHEGVISMYIEDIGNIYINAATGKFDKFSPVEIKGMTMEELLVWPKEMEKSISVITSINDAISELGPVGDEFAKYSKEAHHCYVTLTNIEE